ncbi:unnamed protein product, partial [Didymodactylos carnosus]
SNITSINVTTSDQINDETKDISVENISQNFDEVIVRDSGQFEDTNTHTHESVDDMLCYYTKLDAVMDDYCKHFSVININSVPRSFVAIRNNLSNVSVDDDCYNCKNIMNNRDQCQTNGCEQNDYNVTPPHIFYKLSIISQLKNLFVIPNLYNKMCDGRKQVKKRSKMINDIYEQENDDCFTFTMNTDGIQYVVVDANTSVIDDSNICVVIGDESYLMENLLVAGIWPGPHTPDQKIFQSILASIVDELNELETGQEFSIDDLKSTKKQNVF